MPNLFALINDDTALINVNNVTSIKIIGGAIQLKTIDGDTHPVKPPYPFTVEQYFHALREKVEYITVGGI